MKNKIDLIAWALNSDADFLTAIGRSRSDKCHELMNDYGRPPEYLAEDLREIARVLAEHWSAPIVTLCINNWQSSSESFKNEDPPLSPSTYVRKVDV